MLAIGQESQPDAKDKAPTTLHLTLRQYFYSGWAFLIPYLAAYLLYAWLKWPANSFAPSALGNGGYIPALLHVYWALHAVHLALASIALRSWWRESSAIGPPSSVLRPLIPWLLLALIFYIPGAYLEWPADPWEHLLRMADWNSQNLVQNPLAGYKSSSYFLAFSFIEALDASHWFLGLRAFYTAICLLLAWQYYRLARALGHRPFWAFFVSALSPLLLGNVSFSFYRYYGLSSSPIAQIGAIALVLLALRSFGSSERASDRTHGSSATSPDAPWAARYISTALSYCSLMLLTAFSHVQGLAIAALGAVSLGAWHLVRPNRQSLWILMAVAVASVGMVLWWPNNPAVNQAYDQAWLGTWQGFNLFTWPSPAADRALQIVGGFGMLNLMAGVFLLARNHPVGWLTVGPVLALALPLVAIPFASLVPQIFIFHRLLFAIPPGLALVTLFQDRRRHQEAGGILWPWIARHLPGVRFAVGGWHQAIIPLVLFALVIVPADAPYYNRLWHTVAVIPDDLALRKIWNDVRAEVQDQPKLPHTVGAPAARYLLLVEGEQRFFLPRRPLNGTAPLAEINRTLNEFPQRETGRVALIKPTAFFSSQSFAAFSTRHWISQEAMLMSAGEPELSKQILGSGQYFPRPTEAMHFYRRIFPAAP